MNNPSPNPLVPQGSNAEQKNKNRARVRLAVFCVLSVHVIGLMALLMQGCRKPPEEVLPPETNAIPVVDTNAVPVETNTLVAVETNTAPVVPEVPVPTTQEYTVAKNDSFYTIAKKFNVTMKAIQDANPTVDPKKLQIGHKLQIPASTAPTTAPTVGASVVEAATSGVQTYTVKSGDNLTKIAARHGVTVKALRSENNLTSDRIKVGEKLKIPAKAAAPEVPVVPVSEPQVAPATTPPTQ